ncbi:hypothetical protein QBC36DRAFT_323363 [Triangularia setosa]|uniref:Secreted protein n=1 Tax=Triangularia setosa TaxID=2587417 RepID=A0AAN6WBT8_9PEZI|nr:hypothetical protein QBC36DRAFT_323363 [Podospora setosa]
MFFLLYLLGFLFDTPRFTRTQYHLSNWIYFSGIDNFILDGGVTQPHLINRRVVVHKQYLGHARSYPSCNVTKLRCRGWLIRQ